MNNSEKNKKTFLIGLLPILGLFIFLGLFRLDYKSLWADEAMTINYCYAPLDHLHIARPLYYLTLRLWSHFTESEFGFRLLSVIFGAGSLVTLFLIASKLRDLETAIIVSLLYAVSSGHIYYAQEVRFYTMLSFTALLQMLFFILLLQEFKWSRFILYWLAVFLCLFTNPFGILINGVQNAYLLINIKKQKAFFKKFMAVQVIFLILGTPVIIFLWKELTYFLNVHWIGRLELPTIINFNKLGMYVGKSLFRYYSQGLTPFVSIIGALTILTSICNIYYIIKRREEKNIDLIVLWFLLPILFLLVLGLFDIKLFYHRYIFFLSSAAYLNITVGLMAVGKKYRYTALVIILLVSSIYLVDYYRSDYRNGENWRAVASYIEEENIDAQVVLVPSYTSFAFRYYYKNHFIVGKDISKEIQKKQIENFFKAYAGDKSNLWLVILGQRWKPVIQYLEEKDLIIRKEKFGRIRIILTKKK